MTVYILGAASLILLILIVWRGSSPRFRLQSERPKFTFLDNLRSGRRASSEEEKPAYDGRDRQEGVDPNQER